jgi:hypothetical protein
MDILPVGDVEPISPQLPKLCRQRQNGNNRKEEHELVM